MTGKAILEAMSFVEDKYIEEAESGTFRSGTVVRRLLPLAACLCLLLLGMRHINLPAANETEADQDNMVAQQEVKVETYYKQESAAHDRNDYALVMDESEVMPDAGEVPSVILRIEGWNTEGFAATVVRNVDSQTLAPSTQLQVIFTENICIEEISGDLVQVQRREPTEADFPAGSLIRVRYQYHTDDGILCIESICMEVE